MADGREALEALDGGAVGKAVADEAELALGVEDAPVEGDDAGRLLAAVLQGVQAERGDGRGVRMAENAEDAAFLAQRVAVEVKVGPARASACHVSDRCDIGHSLPRAGRARPM